MSKHYTSHNLIERYNSIKNMIQYHESSLCELLNSQLSTYNDKEQTNLYCQGASQSLSKFEEYSIKYHANQITEFKNALHELCLRKDFNEEYVTLFLQKQSFTNLNFENEVLGGEVTDSHATCCVVM